MLDDISAVLRHGHGPPLRLPNEVWQLVMDSLYNYSSPKDHCYRNQPTYRNWSLVCHAWRTHAQGLLFRIIELTDPASLHKFSAHLDFVPHLALHVRSLRVYSRHLFTKHNVFALLPDELGAKLPNLCAVSVTEISIVDRWHPLSSLPPSPAKLPYVPLPKDFPTALTSLCYVTVLELFSLTFSCFSELACAVHAFHNLRVLAIVQVDWKTFDLPPFMLKIATDGECDEFLPIIEDLTLLWLEEHGAEQILAALSPSATNSLTRLSIDCPLFSPSSRPTSGRTNADGPLEADLSHFRSLRDLSISIIHPLTACRCVPDSFSALLASWAPLGGGDSGGAAAGVGTLAITSAFEWNFTREEFVSSVKWGPPPRTRCLLGMVSRSLYA